MIQRLNHLFTFQFCYQEAGGVAQGVGPEFKAQY
jgi:hypothetical protein